MPEKSVREMTLSELRHYSLEGRTFRSTLFATFLLGLVALAIGLTLYTLALVDEFITAASNLSGSAAAIVEGTVDVEPFTSQVLAAYRAQTDEERAQGRSEAYRARFAVYTKNKDYLTIRRILKDFNRSTDMDAIYMAMYDEKTSSMVYLVDPDESEETGMLPGDYDLVNRKGMEHFLNWNGEGKLYEIEWTKNYGLLCTGGVPFYNSDGDIVAFILTDISLGVVLKGMRDFVIRYVLAIFVLINLLGFMMSRYMRKTLVHPINEIAQAAQRYLDDRKSGIHETNHFGDLNIHTGDEVENLSLIMADMEDDLAVIEDSLTQVTIEKERIRSELALANKIQAAMIPHIYPAFPERTEFDIYAMMEPAKEVGGDFYDFFLIDDDKLCMVMADVSGKGVPAALFMMASKIILQSCAMLGGSPAEILMKTNEAICSNNQEEMFVTVWLGILEISTGKLTAANAGHEYPVLKHPNGQFELYKDKHGFVIGGMAGMKYREYVLQLEPGSKLFLYTDGIPEATNAALELFGTERMVNALNACDGSPKENLQYVRQAVSDFVLDAEQFDDLTMLCMTYRPEKRDD